MLRTTIKCLGVRLFKRPSLAYTLTGRGEDKNEKSNFSFTNGLRF